MAVPTVTNLLFTHPLLIFGFFLSSAYILALFLEKFNLPHILSYLFIGFFYSNFFFQDIFNDPAYSSEIKLLFHTVEIFALGLIGFQIGTELDLKQLMQEPRKLAILVAGNMIGTFVIVAVVMAFFSFDFITVLILAALATSTAPAATVGVIKKLKAKGEVTQKVQWVLAFDDVASVMLVEAILIFALISFGGAATFAEFTFSLGKEIGLAIVLGFVGGFILNKLVEKMEDPVTKMEISLGITILVIGISEFVETSAITATMMLGATVINLGKNDFIDVQHIIDIIMSPVIAIFFILIGIKMELSVFSPFPFVALFYFTARIIGKFVGAYFPARQIGIAEPKRTGFSVSLFAQGGVVLGLASIVAEKLESIGKTELGTYILGLVLISTILSELVGVIAADWGIKRSGEAEKIIEKDSLPTAAIHHQ
ncbi:MAG: cation:proton antiporter [Methanobacteriota archaeon]|nr:MAG: cation:proton antiporter [Euryarchaeota archaeon]